MKVTLSEALLRRKELAAKLQRLEYIKEQDFFETRAKRVKVDESIDDLILQVPKMTASQFTREYDWHAKQLRLVDSLIQFTNHTTKVEVEAEIMGTFDERPGQGQIQPPPYKPTERPDLEA